MNDYAELVEKLDQIIAVLRLCVQKLEEQNQILHSRLDYQGYPPYMAKDK